MSRSEYEQVAIEFLRVYFESLLELEVPTIPVCHYIDYGWLK